MTPRAGHPTFEDCTAAHRLHYWLFGLFGSLLVGYLCATGYALDKAAAATAAAHEVQAANNERAAAQGERDKHVLSALEEIKAEMRKMRDELAAAQVAAAKRP